MTLAPPEGFPDPINNNNDNMGLGFNNENDNNNNNNMNGNGLQYNGLPFNAPPFAAGGNHFDDYVEVEEDVQGQHNNNNNRVPVGEPHVEEVRPDGNNVNLHPPH